MFKHVRLPKQHTKKAALPFYVVSMAGLFNYWTNLQGPPALHVL